MFYPKNKFRFDHSQPHPNLSKKVDYQIPPLPCLLRVLMQVDWAIPTLTAQSGFTSGGSFMPKNAILLPPKKAPFEDDFSLARMLVFGGYFCWPFQGCEISEARTIILHFHRGARWKVRLLSKSIKSNIKSEMAIDFVCFCFLRLLSPSPHLMGSPVEITGFFSPSDALPLEGLTFMPKVGNRVCPPVPTSFKYLGAKKTDFRCFKRGR